MSESTGVAPPLSRWGDHCLAVCRGAAVTAVVAVTFSTALTSAACAVMLLSWAISGQVKTTLGASLREPLGIALAVFLVLAAIGMLYSSAPWSDRLHTLSGWRRFGYALILLGVFAPVAWKQRFLAAFFVAASLGLVASFLAWMEIIGSRHGDFTGTVLQNHSMQGIVFSLAILCAAHYARTASARIRWGLAVGVVLFAVNIIFVTGARSAYVALFVVALFSCVVLYGWRRAYVWLPAGVALAILAIVASPALRDRFTQGWNEFDGAADPAITSVITPMGIRAVLYSTTFELIRERPVFGHGTGSFGKEYSARVTQRYSDWRADPIADPHSQYLYIMVELGMVGLVAFIAVLIAGFFSARAGPYGWLAGGALTIWCLTSLFSSHFRTFPEGHLIGLFLGALLAAPASPPGSLTGPRHSR
jgi:O-antigen ligase